MSDLNSEPTSSRRLWVLAAVMALALHLGGAALALAHLRTDDSDDGLGANGAEFAVEMASPKVPDYDLPPGPDSEQAPESPQVNEQKAEVNETDLPKEKPNEAEDPDKIVTENNSKKPDEDDQKVAAVEAQASEASQAQIESARQTLDEKAREADKATSPSLGIGKDKLKLTANWGRKISAYFELHKRYPKDRNTSAKVKVSLVLNRRGNLVSVDVAESSGDPVFDEAALSMIRRSDPVPRPPAGLTDETFPFSLDINFKKPRD